MKKVDHWLAVRLGHLGDVVLATGVLRYFGENNSYRFSVLTKEEWADVFTGHPYVDEVIGLKEEELKTKSFIKISHNLSKKFFGKGLLDLHSNTRTSLLKLFWHGPTVTYPKMNFLRRAFLLSGGMIGKERLSSLSVPQRYAQSFSSDTKPMASELLPQLYLSNEEKEKAKLVLSKIFFKDVDPVAIHPFASHINKTWSPKIWLACSKSLEKKNIPWIAIGAGKDIFSPNRQSLIGKTTLRETCALLSCCRAIITGDSGPMHLARAVKTPVIALFGPTTKEWGFFPEKEEGVVFEKNYTCRPCSLHGQGVCSKDGFCLRDLLPEQILASPYIRKRKDNL